MGVPIRTFLTTSPTTPSFGHCPPNACREYLNPLTRPCHDSELNLPGTCLLFAQLLAVDGERQHHARKPPSSKWGTKTAHLAIPANGGCSGHFLRRHPIPPEPAVRATHKTAAPWGNAEPTTGLPISGNTNRAGQPPPFTTAPIGPSQPAENLTSRQSGPAGALRSRTNRTPACVFQACPPPLETRRLPGMIPLILPPPAPLCSSAPRHGLPGPHPRGPRKRQLAARAHKSPRCPPKPSAHQTSRPGAPPPLRRPLNGWPWTTFFFTGRFLPTHPKFLSQLHPLRARHSAPLFPCPRLFIPDVLSASCTPSARPPPLSI